RLSESGQLRQGEAISAAGVKAEPGIRRFGGRAEGARGPEELRDGEPRRESVPKRKFRRIPSSRSSGDAGGKPERFRLRGGTPRVTGFGGGGGFSEGEDTHNSFGGLAVRLHRHSFGLGRISSARPHIAGTTRTSAAQSVGAHGPEALGSATEQRPVGADRR